MLSPLELLARKSQLQDISSLLPLPDDVHPLSPTDSSAIRNSIFSKLFTPRERHLLLALTGTATHQHENPWSAQLIAREKQSIAAMLEPRNHSTENERLMPYLGLIQTIINLSRVEGVLVTPLYHRLKQYAET